MFDFLSLSNLKIPPLSEEIKTILRETKIDADYPGTILSDWQTMLDYIGSDGIEVSKKQGYFRMKVLAEINQKLTHPILIDLKRPQQKSYPYIHGLYLLLRTSGITRIIHQGSKAKIVINADVLKSWQRLNPTEQYLILLEIWLFWASEDALEGYHHFPYLLVSQRLWQLITVKGVKITAKNESIYNLNSGNDLTNIAVLNSLGIIDLKQRKPQLGKGWGLTYLAKTPLGEAFIEIMNRCICYDEFPDVESEATEIRYGKLQPYLQEYFPEFKQQLLINNSSQQEGIFIFKVSVSKAWRRISIPSDCSLEDLVDAILEAFNFDKDYLYRFICCNRLGIPFNINCPDLDEPPYTTEFLVKQLPLELGGQMIFEVDFGDDWEFSIVLEAINPVDPKQKEAKLIASGGKAPSQYDWDDEDADW
jgi:hypothetical protein